ncbi:tRNA (adenosine(37)-N6)-threonylcarbamoyltransferase complex ATPase subunit type 1 TsaE [Candidatus Minimicrobia naudis]|uniref:tRNA threonylcarbamoyladenosine biosynthesis protein TsaE n=1 Tax=Candidatus Minimicrobia naudis TaxID=2841263 RepID=A0A8F1SB09_9BACT|nr:tRNA (adenosine(37)-N6)-threonylcarbamoyltransferase complex ATPase subunit type 1 TsaE [Candidatus Minimicrobia naudis]
MGAAIGRAVSGGEVLELVGDIGAGKTTLTKGIAQALEIDEPVQSPTFTISRVYDSPSGLSLAHYDFYRLGNAGIMSEEIREAVDNDSVVVVEWAGAVDGDLPEDRLVVKITATSEEERLVEFHPGGRKSAELWQKIKENLV